MTFPNYILGFLEVKKERISHLIDRDIRVLDKPAITVEAISCLPEACSISFLLPNQMKNANFTMPNFLSFQILINTNSPSTMKILSSSASCGIFSFTLA